MKKIYLTLLVLTLIESSMNTQAQKVFHNENNVAIDGYDVVSYFTKGKAVKGTSKVSTTYQGSHFYFSSEANKKAFVKQPSNYLPQYDGYCAYAVAAKNKKVPTNPETFKIVDGKLYLFFNDLYEGKPMNTIVPWNADEAKLLSQADGNWNTLKND